MVTYAIGDIQGCERTLQRLLQRLRQQAGFDPARDALWLVGDLVNRGPHSLAVLRWALDQATSGRADALGERLVCVLGNHDLHLLACAAGAAEPKPGDTLDEVLAAPDRPALIDWLRRQPMIHVAPGLGSAPRLGGVPSQAPARPHVLVHAGLPLDWSVAQAVERAAPLHAELAGPRWQKAAADLKVPTPKIWNESLRGAARSSAVAAALTRLRAVRKSGQLVLSFKGPPREAPPGSGPWFEAPQRAAADHVIVCGHWAALGLHLTDNVLCLDSACVWGGPLTAVRLADRPEERAVFQEPNAERT